MVQEALAIQREKGGRIGEILIGLGSIQPADLARGLADQAGMAYLDLQTSPPEPAALSRLDAVTARTFGVVPVSVSGRQLTVVLADPVNAAVLSDIGFATGMEVVGAIADEAQIRETLDQHYRDEPTRSKQQMKELVAEFSQAGGKFDLEDKASMAAAAPVVKLLNYVLYQAIRDKASDIHLEPFERDFKIRYRVDGVLYELEAPPAHLAVALVSRVKVLADLDIAETRLPQDGRIELAVGGKPVDLRVSTLPTMFGESTVMRILDRSVVSLNLESIGLGEHQLAHVRGFTKLPHGIVLVTGPTGSGKTTTLYAVLNEANREEVKIITTEDPVEYDLEGIVQIPVNEEIGVTYAKVLRTILRQDPDIILVGEIRDRETAQIAIEASLTGHLVFSTLHTNDAPSAITRLADMGIEPFLITATMREVVAQRLVRRICSKCRTQYTPAENVLQELQLTAAEVGSAQFAYGKGCEVCNFTGFKGRMALAEIMTLDDRLKQLVLDRASSSTLHQAARESGMKTLRDAGLAAVFSCQTTVEEVLRETFHTG
ncbi:MAG: type II/IV secretion system protein [Planctomycetes bacterium]|nr:type II/IV secretion system protein [Planctomycetota bacterium]